MIDKQLIEFITEARKRGFSDFQIKRALISNKWPVKIVEDAFQSLNPKVRLAKNQVYIFLSDEVLTVLEKRAKKNLMNLQEQIEDILRRSCVRKKAVVPPEKIDDLLVACFSRSQRGKKK
jgi:hypothetical protein